MAIETEAIDMSFSPDISQKLSILEKTLRLTELHDPDLIDIENIQHLASNLGYNLNVKRNEVGGFGEFFGTPTLEQQATSATDSNRYLRFMTSNLPNIYKIKTTEADIQLMLYSFGLVGDLVKYCTDSYLTTEEGGFWRADFEKDLSRIPNTYFITPHFALVVEVDESTDLILDTAKRSAVIRAIESVRPINTVFRNLTGHITRQYDVQVNMATRFTRYIRIPKTDDEI